MDGARAAGRHLRVHLFSVLNPAISTEFPLRTFVSHAVLFLGLQLALLAAFEYSYDVDYNTFTAVSIEKQALLAAPSAKPRLVLVGGSNVAFGFDCSLLDERLPYAPVNMGVNAGYGLDYMLAEALDGLRPGDVVLLSPEYGHFVELRAEVALFELLEVHPDAIDYLGAPYIGPLMDRASEHLGRQLKRALFGWLIDTSRGMPYRRDGIDRYGDVVGHTALAAPGPRDLDTVLTLSGRSLSRAERRLRAFAREVSARDARLFYLHPPIPDRLFVRWQPDIARIEEVVDRIGLSVIDAPRALPIEHFYDTKYHLTRAAARERTEALLIDLETRLGRAP